MADFPLRGFVYKRKQYFSSFENISTLISTEINGATLQNGIHDHDQHQQQQQQEHVVSESSACTTREHSPVDTGETRVRRGYWVDSVDDIQKVPEAKATHPGSDSTVIEDYMQESSYTAAYQSRMEALKMIEQLRPRRQRVNLNWLDDQKDEKKIAKNTSDVCPTNGDVSLSKWSSLPTLGANDSVSGSISGGIPAPTLNNNSSAPSKKSGKGTLRRQWACVFSQRLHFIRDKLESRSSNQAENTKWQYINGDKKRRQDVNVEHIKTVVARDSPNESRLEPAESSTNQVEPSLEARIVNELNSKNLTDDEKKMSASSTDIEKIGMFKGKRAPPRRPPLPIYAQLNSNGHMKPTPSSGHYSLIKSSESMSSIGDVKLSSQDYVSSAVSRQKSCDTYSSSLGVRRPMPKPLNKGTGSFKDELQEKLQKRRGSFTTVVPSITDSTESTNGTVTNGNGIKSEVRSNGVHVTSIPCNGLSKKDIKAEHKLPNGLTSQIKQSNGTSKLPSNGTPEISANGTSGLSSHEQRIPNGSLPSHTTIPPSSPTTTVLPPAFMPSQGFTAEDKVNERVTLKSWDPTKLLNELYAIRLVADLEKPPNYINTEGYLEKLPTNKKKATLLKTWKKRYFRTKNGRLSYYENGKAAKNDTGDNVYKNSHQHDKSHGYLQLTDGTIEVLGNHMLGVDDKRGHYMVLRCHTDEEFSKWKRSLDSQTVDYCKMNYVKPVLYSQPSTEKKVVIVDIGSCSVRAGILGEQPSLPQIFFPCIVATSKDGSDRVLGVDAMKPSTRSTRNLTYPVRPSIKIDKCSMDMEVMPDIFSKVFHDLKINPAEHWMMFSTPGNFNDTIKADFMTMFIQKFGMCGANIVNQTLLSLYSYNSQTGIVVDIGERLEIVPVTDGYIADAGVTRQPYGGHRVTEAMNSALTEYKYRFFTDVEFQLVRLITEKTSFVSENYAHDIKQSSTNIEAYRRITDMEQYDLPKGSWSHIVSDIGRFKSTEGLFSTGIWGLDNPPLHTLVQKAVQACPMDMRKQMWRSIFLSGGTSMIPGFPERLQAELQKLAPGSVNVKVIASPQRYHAAYIGACTMASLGGAFEQACISAKQWNSEGTSSLSKWHMY